MNNFFALVNDFPLWLRLLSFSGLAILTHLVVVGIRQISTRILSSHATKQYRKLKSIATLATSAIVFSLYFLTMGFILREFGVSLTAYLASASVIGLAIGFGSQGIVQDVVMGLTFIFSDLVDVGDLVEISGQTGIVRGITMRFVKLENSLGATVYIPNRTINNVVNYPRGYVRYIVDITLRGDEAAKSKTVQTANLLMQSAQKQFNGILMTEPSSEGRIQLTADKEILRLKFRIWPNRGEPIEKSYVQELIATLKLSDPDYQPWMVAVNYEVEKKIAQLRNG